jgi:hypothetical protein
MEPELNNQQEQETEVDLNEKEWTLKKILIRMIAYPFCLFMVGIGIYMILHPAPGWPLQRIAGVGLIYFGIYYLYIDVKIILKKSKSS